MYADIADLRSFYESRLGRVAKRLLRRKVLEIWPNLEHHAVLGLGYAVPLLRPYQLQGARIAAVMPAGQGVIGWPREGAFRSVLAHEIALPFADCSFDAIILMHCMESTEHLRQMLREAWRVLAEQGRVLIIVPNRMGLWARLENTPFGEGHPYTMRQLKDLVRSNLLTPVRFERALYMPPSKMAAVHQAGVFLEKLGERCMHNFSGVVIIEASKQVYGLTPTAPVTIERRRQQVVKPAATAGNAADMPTTRAIPTSAQKVDPNKWPK